MLEEGQLESAEEQRAQIELVKRNAKTEKGGDSRGKERSQENTRSEKHDRKIGGEQAAG